MAQSKQLERAVAGTPAAGGWQRRPLHRMVYPLRMLGMGLGALPIGVVLAQQHAPLAVWALLVFTALAWPQLALWRARRSRNPHHAERANLLLDSALAGLWVPLLHFNLLPSALLATLATVDKINTGIRGLWLRSLPCLFGATALGSLMTGLAFQPESDMRVILACIPLLLIHTVAVSLNGYRLVRQVNIQNRRLDELSRTDPLTGLDNRRHWELHTGALLQQHLDAGAPASLLMVDVDNFKVINDTYGHACGDEVIRAVARLLGEHVNAEERCARYGGDEFAVVLAADQARAHAVAENIRRAVQALRLDSAPGLNCSVSQGIATTKDPETTLSSLLAAADAALYRAKRAGRNRVLMAADDASLPAADSELSGPAQSFRDPA